MVRRREENVQSNEVKNVADKLYTALYRCDATMRCVCLRTVRRRRQFQAKVPDVPSAKVV